MNTLEYALYLAGNGLPVFPCNENKSPMIKGGFKSASKDPKTIRDLFENVGDCLIGVPTGSLSGIDVLDIDPKNGGNQWHDENIEYLSQFRCHKTRSGGFHYIFNHAEDVKNSASKIADGVDVRGDGGYIIWWPYNGLSVSDVQDIYDWPKDLLKIAKKQKRKKINTEETLSNLIQPIPSDIGGTPYGIKALMEEKLNVATCKQGTRDDTINKAFYCIGSLVSGGELSEELARPVMLEGLNIVLPECQDKEKAIRCADRAYEDGKNNPRRSSTIMNAEQYVEDFKKLDEIKAQPDHEYSKKIESRYSLFKRVSEDDILSHMPSGFISDMVSHILACSVRPQPLAAVAASIAFTGSIAGRRYKTERNTHTNIYVSTLIDSGGGKEAARQTIKSVLSCYPQWAGFMAGDSMTSGAAIENKMKERASFMFAIDEVGDFIKTNVKDAAGTYKSDIAPMLKSLFSESTSSHSGKVYASSKESKESLPIPIYNPCMTIYGTGVPLSFWKGFDEKSMQDGLVGRMLIFQPDQHYPECQEKTYSGPVPQNITQAVSTITTKGTGITENCLMADIGTKTFNSKVVLMNNEAKERMRDILKQQTELLRKNEGQYLTSIIARMGELIEKVALIYAISVNPVEPVITTEAVEWGYMIYARSANTIYSGFMNNQPKTKNQENVLMIRKAIQEISAESGKKGVTLTEINRKVDHKISGKDRKSVIDDLLESGDIIKEVIKNQRGRPTELYYNT